MSRLSLVVRLVAVVIAVWSLAPAAIVGQPANGASAPTEPWAVPRTPDGHPDLQGLWTNETFTPLERPAELAGKEFFTDEEAAQFLASRVDTLEGQSKTDIHYDDALWQTETTPREPNRRTSLIVDPPDGKVPPLTPEGERLTRGRPTVRGNPPADSVETRTLAERCISWGNVGPPMIPPTYNANLQIFQSAGHVVIHHEMIHDDRVIPLDGRPHLPAGIRLLAGDSRGRWEGDTLVVDTTNFTSRTNFRGPPRNTRQDIFHTEGLHVVERFTRVAADRIVYRFTVDDPTMWSRPWSGEVPIRRFDGPLFEYACHEGNYGLLNILQSARNLEKRTVAAGGPSSR